MAENYTDLYKEMVFFRWHSEGRVISPRFCNSLPDENGTRPTHKAVEKWRDMYGWVQRADALDVELSNRLRDEYIEKRNAMFEKHIDVASTLLEKANAFIKTMKFEEPSDVLRAIALGIEIERASIGQVEMGQRILEMSNDQLDKALLKLVGKDVAPDIDIIEGETEQPDEPS